MARVTMSTTLLDQCLTAVVRSIFSRRGDVTTFSPNGLLQQLPAPCLVDILHHMLTSDDWRDPDAPDLSLELDFIHSYLVPLFPSLLTARNKRPLLFELFKTATEKEFLRGRRENKTETYRENSDRKSPPPHFFPPHLPHVLAKDFIQKQPHPSPKDGLLLGEFLMNAGWFFEAQLVLGHTLSHSKSKFDITQQLSVLGKLVQSQSNYNMVPEARSSCAALTDLVHMIKSTFQEEVYPNLASTFNAISIHHYSESRYDVALRWSVAALNELCKIQVPSQDLPQDSCLCYCCCPSWAATVVDVLRQCATCCSVKRELHKAELLVIYAMGLARGLFGPNSVKFAEALTDFGFFLISSDNPRRGAEIYEQALDIRREAFGTFNLFTALSLTELSYSRYVQEYNTGRFDEARRYAEEAMAVAGRLLPPTHLLQASSSRVLALILEEIAIDNVGSPTEQELLGEAESLHSACLTLTLSVFGDMNVQTAKHYGNLGRLYQTMKKYRDAEVMHLKAIAIKERLLGECDYEVALSLGHLASLYNYDLLQFGRAEELHLRSICIGRRLFGDAYSGLEYDYRGLLQVYLMTGRNDKYEEYSRLLSQWKGLQDLKAVAAARRQSGTCMRGEWLEPLGVALSKFNELKWARWTEQVDASGQIVREPTPS